LISRGLPTDRHHKERSASSLQQLRLDDMAGPAFVRSLNSAPSQPPFKKPDLSQGWTKAASAAESAANEEEPRLQQCEGKEHSSRLKALSERQEALGDQERKEAARRLSRTDPKARSQGTGCEGALTVKSKTVRSVQYTHALYTTRPKRVRRAGSVLYPLYIQCTRGAHAD